MKAQDMARHFNKHTDTIKAALGVIPQWLLLELPESALLEMVGNILSYYDEVFDQGHANGKLEAAKE